MTFVYVCEKCVCVCVCRWAGIHRRIIYARRRTPLLNSRDGFPHSAPQRMREGWNEEETVSERGVPAHMMMLGRLFMSA